MRDGKYRKLGPAIEFAPLIGRAQEQWRIRQVILAIERKAGCNWTVDAGKLELDYDPTSSKIQRRAWPEIATGRASPIVGEERDRPSANSQGASQPRGHTPDWPSQPA
jgi:hypothetical protein